MKHLMFGYMKKLFLLWQKLIYMYSISASNNFITIYVLFFVYLRLLNTNYTKRNMLIKKKTIIDL